MNQHIFGPQVFKGPSQAMVRPRLFSHLVSIPEQGKTDSTANPRGFPFSKFGSDCHHSPFAVDQTLTLPQYLGLS